MVKKQYELSTISSELSSRGNQEIKATKKSTQELETQCPSKMSSKETVQPDKSGVYTAHLDDVLNSLGWFGRFQKVQCFLLVLHIIDSAIHAMSFIFIGKHVEQKCAAINQTGYIGEMNYGLLSYLSDSNSTASGAPNSSLPVIYGACSVSEANQSEEGVSGACPNGYEYAEPRDRSYVSEWDLVCEKDFLPDLSQTVLSAGMMLGAFLFTSLADKYGRKPVYVTCHVLMLCVAGITAFVPNYTAFLVVRFFLGALQQGTDLTAWILLLELIPRAKRAWPSRIGCVMWSSGLLLLGLVCWWCRKMSWRNRELVLAAISIYSLLQWFLVKESLRWLTAKGRADEAKEMVSKMAKTNGVDAAEPLKLFSTISDNFLNPDPTTKQCKVTGVNDKGTDDLRLTAFLRNKHILRVAAINCYIWFTDSLAYYVLVMTSPSLTNDFYLGYTLNILVELPAAFFFSVFITRIGRRYCAMASHLIGGVSLLVAVLLSNTSFAAGIPALDILVLVASLVGKFGITLGFSVFWLYTPELYPTTIRTTGVGLASLFARVAGMIAPYSRLLSQHLPWGPGTVLSALCLTVPLLVRFLPETHGRELPQTIAEMEVGTATESSRHEKDIDE
ncbi:solute carrier family 22 member 4 [Plakobranchus ocellatus]|uniref:Solute carrier family 22 member 4 n=1 Tax=Plakobranchus ocellatus TaxID=259542 RepID=A0AAV3XYK0_9GAST|nr:solute carrier family 22 member 4 [Plakobranchus ocellatus]